ncbi:MAG: hypothetical protein JSV43_01700 [Methanobacteriota archaeon]|nr:MAG: hypothetical protein JSV43_01700 [Euryarchaeota archaeon]
MSECPTCDGQLAFVQQYSQWYCYHCQQYYQPGPPPSPGQKEPPRQPYPEPHPGTPAPQPTPQPTPPQPAPEVQIQPQQPQIQVQEATIQPTQPTANPIWYQNTYRIRKKVLTVGNKYWIEDDKGNMLGFSKQKLFKLKEDIRIYTDEKMGTELFRIKQEQILDLWGSYAVIDSQTNQKLGTIKRGALSSAFVRDEWEVYDPYGRLVGGIYEETGRGLARKYVSGGSLIPEKMSFFLQGQPVARINQKFKIIGDIWHLYCDRVPPHFDRRVLLACLLLMGMIERDRK